jgi:hypothetical protein
MLLLRYGSQSPCDVHSMNEGQCNNDMDQRRGWRDGDVVFLISIGTRYVHGKAGDLPSCFCLRVASQASLAQYRHVSLVM